MDMISVPVIQYGFAGVTAVLLGIIVWMIRQLLAVLSRNSAVISENSEAFRTLGEHDATTHLLLREQRDMIMADHQTLKRVEAALKERYGNPRHDVERREGGC